MRAEGTFPEFDVCLTVLASGLYFRSFAAANETEKLELQGWRERIFRHALYIHSARSQVPFMPLVRSST